MRTLFICLVMFSLVISLVAIGSVSAQDNSTEIANLQYQIDRLQNLMNLGSQEIDRVAGQTPQAIAQQIRTWETHLSNIDSLIAKLDSETKNTSEQQQSELTQALNNTLKQKVGTEAYLVQLKMQNENELNKLNQGKSNFTEPYVQNIDNLKNKLNNLIQVNCCLDGSCSQKSRAECASAGGTVTTDCAQECSKN